MNYESTEQANLGERDRRVTETELTASNSSAAQFAYPDVRSKATRSTVFSASTPPGSASPDSALLESHRNAEEQQRREYLEQRDMLQHLLQDAQRLLGDLLAQECRRYWDYCAQLHAKRHLGQQETTTSRDQNSSPESPTTNTNTDTRTKLPGNLRVLGLNVKSTGSRSSADAARHLDHQLHVSLLLQKLQDVGLHLERLSTRVQDTRSRVLVTGDLNAGKSTLINALLRREILPYDQQPCTAAFCEVMDARENEGVEEVHAVVDPAKYNRTDPSTFTRFPLSQMIAAHQENEQFSLWRVYCKDASSGSQSLLHNGLVDVTLIDSPGLNRDLSQTMAVFAQHEEIDAVIFVVNAENHFTLSGADFISEARQEKPLMMVAVNRYDSIADKKRCQMEIRQQLEHLLPATLAEEKDLLHFISAQQFLRKHQPSPTQDGSSPTAGSVSEFAFQDMETCLRSFLLEKRVQSKLAPAANFLLGLASDVQEICGAHMQATQEELDTVRSCLETSSPQLHSLVELDRGYADEIEQRVMLNTNRIRKHFSLSMDTLVGELSSVVAGVRYRGALFCTSYAKNIVRVCQERLQATLWNCQQVTVEESQHAIQDMHQRATVAMVPALPPLDQLLEPIPQAIALRAEGDATSMPMLQVHVKWSDFVELPELTPGMLVMAASVAGAGKVVGYQRVGSGFMSIAQLLGVRSASSVVLGTLAIVGIGSCVYFVHRIPHTLSKKLTRKIHRQLTHPRRAHHLLAERDRLAHQSRRIVDQQMFELKKAASIALEQQQRLHMSQELRREEAERVHVYFTNVQQKATGLRDALEDKWSSSQHIRMRHHNVMQ